MSEENNLEEIKKFWPKDAPNVLDIEILFLKTRIDDIIIMR